MTLRVDEIHSIEKAKSSSRSRNVNTDAQVFKFSSELSTDTTSGWDISYYQTIKKWGAKDYKWTTLVDTNNAIEKSQQSLMDLLRYFEGDSKNNYKAKSKFTDLKGKGTRTYGYGITQLPKALGIKLSPPQNEAEAYKVLMLYLDKVSYPETKSMFKKEWKTFPQSLKEALLDFNFNKGTPILKDQSKEIKEAYKKGDWAKLLNNLVYVYPGASKAKKEEEAGLYKRSLSRAILAVRDIEKTPEINKTIKSIYEKTRDCAIKQGKDIAEIDKIYNAYLNEGKVIEEPVKNEKTNKLYNITDKISVYSLALSLRPAGQNTDCLKAIINEIIKLNDLKTEGFDDKGFPKCGSIENEPLKLPTKLVFNGKIINLNTVTKYEEAKTIILNESKDTKQKPQDSAVNNNNVVEEAKTEEKKSISFYEFAKTSISLFFMKLEESVKELFSSESSNVKEECSDFDYTKPPFERLLASPNTKIEQQGEFQIVTADYTIKKGDGVWRLAQTYNLQEDAFCELNNIENKNLIKIGQNVKIQKLAYKVNKGDNLYQISKKTGLEIDVIKDLNNIEDETVIEVNQILELPGFLYEVKKGDTLHDISKKVGMPLSTLMKINNLQTATINPKQKIVVIYNEADYAIPESKRTVVVDTKTNTKVETINMGKARGLATRPLLQKKNKVNGKVIATREVFKPTGSGKLNNRTIIVNAGHGYTASGNTDIGTPGLNGLDHEYLLNYDNAMRLKDELCAQGAKVIFLQGKRNLIYNELSKRNNKADLFISVHVNAGGRSPKDRTEFFLRTEDLKANNKSAKLAKACEKHFDTWISKNEKISANEKFISPSTKKQDYAQVKDESRKKQGRHYRLGLLDKVATTHRNIPSIIWEVAYMNSSKGRERLGNDKLMSDYSKVMTKAIIDTFS